MSEHVPSDSDSEELVWDLLAGSADHHETISNTEESCVNRTQITLQEGSSALCQHGICRFSFEPEAITPLVVLAQALLNSSVWPSILASDYGDKLKLPQACGFSSTGEDGLRQWPNLRLYNSKGSDRLLWLYAGSEEAMHEFDDLVEIVSPMLEAAVSSYLSQPTQLRFCAGSFVVLRDPGARNSEVFAHRDWEDPVLPARSAFTVLTPLVLPLDSAGLELFDCLGSSRGVVSYAIGEAIAFDNFQLHRTQPGPSATRILASLSFAQTSPELSVPINRILSEQTPHFYRRVVIIKGRQCLEMLT